MLRRGLARRRPFCRARAQVPALVELRVGAELADIAIAVGAGILAWLAVRAGDGSPDDADGWAAGVTIIVWLLNAVVIAAITNGQTLGKKVACSARFGRTAAGTGSAPRCCGTSSAG
jgi:hypothetical protein